MAICTKHNRRPMGDQVLKGAARRYMGENVPSTSHSAWIQGQWKMGCGPRGRDSQSMLTNVLDTFPEISFMKANFTG